MRSLSVRARLTGRFALAYFAIAVLLIATAYLTVRAELGDRTAADSAEVLDELFGESDPDAALFDPASVVLPDGRSLDRTVEQLRAALVDDTLDALLWWSSLAALLAGGVAVALGYWTAGRALAPVRNVTETARRLSESTLDERVGYEGPEDELADLANTFDGMLDRIERAFDGQRQFTAMASHELRTPLAQITAATSLARSSPGSISSDELIETVYPAAERATVLVERLLQLMRSQSGVERRTSIRLEQVLAELLDERAAQFADRGVRVEFHEQPLVVDGDDVLIRSMLANAIDNAIRHNRPDGTIEIAHTTDGPIARITIANSGEPMSEAAVRRITEPFRRGTSNPDNVGHGLGTSIIRSVAEVHGGAANYRARAEGGIVLDIDLPITPTP